MEFGWFVLILLLGSISLIMKLLFAFTLAVLLFVVSMLKRPSPPDDDDWTDVPLNKDFGG